jgi:hypothetical protein
LAVGFVTADGVDEYEFEDTFDCPGVLQMTFALCRWQPPTAVNVLIFCDATPTVGFDVAVYFPPTYTVSVLLVTPGCEMAALPVRHRSFRTNTETWTGELPEMVVQPVVELTKKP